MSKYEKRVKEQSKLCLMLMDRLNDDILEAKTYEFKYHNSVEGHYQKKTDIVKLRRELVVLSNMLEEHAE